MKTKSILFAFAMFLLFTASVFAETTDLPVPVAKPIAIEWVEKGVGGKTFTETLYCSPDCETFINKRVKEIESSGGLIIEIREGKE